MNHVLHYNQALLDLEDDFDDIVDEIHDAMPNVFVMASINMDTTFDMVRKEKIRALEILY